MPRPNPPPRISSTPPLIFVNPYSYDKKLLTVLLPLPIIASTIAVMGGTTRPMIDIRRAARVGIHYAQLFQPRNPAATPCNTSRNRLAVAPTPTRDLAGPPGDPNGTAFGRGFLSPPCPAPTTTPAPPTPSDRAQRATLFPLFIRAH